MAGGVGWGPDIWSPTLAILTAVANRADAATSTILPTVSHQPGATPIGLIVENVVFRIVEARTVRKWGLQTA